MGRAKPISTECFKTCLRDNSAELSLKKTETTCGWSQSWVGERSNKYGLSGFSAAKHFFTRLLCLPANTNEENIWECPLIISVIYSHDVKPVWMCCAKIKKTKKWTNKIICRGGGPFLHFWFDSGGVRDLQIFGYCNHPILCQLSFPKNIWRQSDSNRVMPLVKTSIFNPGMPSDAK